LNFSQLFVAEDRKVTKLFLVLDATLLAKVIAGTTYWYIVRK